jgi:hypothetical protein
MKEFGNGNGIVYVNKPEDTIAKAVELVKTREILKTGEKAQQLTINRDWEELAVKFERDLSWHLGRIAKNKVSIAGSGHLHNNE